MKIKITDAKSILIGKKKKDDKYDGMDRPLFVSTFKSNDPHLNGQVPIKRYDFEEGIHKVILKNLKVDYLLAGHDIIINNVKEVTLEKDNKGHLVVSGKQ